MADTFYQLSTICVIVLLGMLCLVSWTIQRKLNSYKQHISVLSDVNRGLHVRIGALAKANSELQNALAERGVRDMSQSARDIMLENSDGNVSLIRVLDMDAKKFANRLIHMRIPFRHAYFGLVGAEQYHHFVIPAGLDPAKCASLFRAVKWST